MILGEGETIWIYIFGQIKQQSTMEKITREQKEKKGPLPPNLQVVIKTASDATEC